MGTTNRNHECHQQDRGQQPIARSPASSRPALLVLFTTLRATPPTSRPLSALFRSSPPERSKLATARRLLSSLSPSHPSRASTVCSNVSPVSSRRSSPTATSSSLPRVAFSPAQSAPTAPVPRRLKSDPVPEHSPPFTTPSSPTSSTPSRSSASVSDQGRWQQGPEGRPR